MDSLAFTVLFSHQEKSPLSGALRKTIRGELGVC